MPVRPTVCARLDRPARGLTSRLYVGLDIRDCFMIMALDGYYTYVILLFATNESSWR